MSPLIQRQIERAWVANDLDVAFQFDDLVTIKSGPRAGESGRIVALFQLEPHPFYVIEYPDGRSENAIEPEIEIVVK